jgi:hypothetical protein
MRKYISQENASFFQSADPMDILLMHRENIYKPHGNKYSSTVKDYYVGKLQ